MRFRLEKEKCIHQKLNQNLLITRIKKIFPLFPLLSFSLSVLDIFRLRKGRDLGRWILHSWIISHLDQDSKKAGESNFCWQNKPDAMRFAKKSSFSYLF